MPHGVVADVNAALEQQVLNIAQAERALTYISTTRRITSGDELDRRKGLGGKARDLRLILSG